MTKLEKLTKTLKDSLIPETEVPLAPLKYLEMFRAIPEGMALVLDYPKYDARKLRAGLHHHQKRHGEFKNYHIFFRRNLKKIYVIHHKKERGNTS